MKKLAHQQQDTSGTGPDYEALSYAWGSDDDMPFVTVSGRNEGTLRITQNLDIALRHLRYEDKHRMIWVDAVCIDQSDHGKVEKSRQVAGMGVVYSTATRVIVWLGPQQDESEKALDIMEHVGRCVDVVKSFDTFRASSECPEKDKEWANPGGCLPFRDGQLEPVLRLFQRPYFHRVWIRQEICLANAATIYCGTRTLDWEVFRKAVVCFRFKARRSSCLAKEHYNDFDKARRSMYNIFRVKAGAYSYTFIRYILGEAECRNPVDKIFAMLALLCGSDRRLDVIPDYQRETEDVYSDVARRVIVRGRELKLLESCVLSTRRLAIPSWTPDWSVPLPLSAELWTTWSACGWITYEVVVPNDHQLHVRGVAVARVRAVTNTIPRIKDDNVRCAMIMEELRKVTPDAADLASRNITRHRWAEALCIALLSPYIAECHYPAKVWRVQLQQYVEALELIQSTTADLKTLAGETSIQLKRLLNKIYHACTGLCFFICDRGYVGLTYAGVKEGDLVSVVLSEKFPVLLRPLPISSPDKTQMWEVVSVAMVGGLANGEAIYGDRLPAHWIAVQLNEGDEDGPSWVDGRPRALYDPEMKSLKADPAAILKEMGIKVETHQRGNSTSFRLEVLPETLRAAGVSLQDFILA